MNIPGHYARALFLLVEDHPQKGLEYLENLRRTLVRRGHGKLFPRVFAEYKKLVLRKERAESRAKETPEQERVRVLVELYRKLIQTA